MLKTEVCLSGEGEKPCSDESMKGNQTSLVCSVYVQTSSQWLLWWRYCTELESCPYRQCIEKLLGTSESHLNANILWVCQWLKTILQAMALVIRNHLVPWKLAILSVFPQAKRMQFISYKNRNTYAMC